MLKKTIVFTALVGFVFTVDTPAPAYGGICLTKHKHTGTGKGPSKKTAKWAARQKWRYGVLKGGHPSSIAWQFSKEQSSSCRRKYRIYTCKVQAIPCEPGSSGEYSLKGVNLTPWCKKKYGRDYKAKLIGKTAGDWVCVYRNTVRKAISVVDACKLQYGRRKVRSAKALNWNDPYSWKCNLRGKITY